ncbi:MAG: hypothetical protein U1E65_18640 [Myxococcota bacterium]
MRASIAWILPIFVACSTASSDKDAAVPDSGVITRDAEASADTGGGMDATSAGMDATSADAAPGMDAASADTGVEADAGMGMDAADTDAGMGDTGCVRHYTFTEVKDNVFVGCGGMRLMTCHIRAPTGGDLDLNPGAAYAALVGVPATQGPGMRVVAGDPANSFLWKKLINAIPMDQSQGDPMPKGEAIMWRPLPDEDLERVRCWIAEGAAND